MMKWRTWAVILSATTVIAFSGAISGTLAWYAYATQASLSYEGTTVYNTKQLQIGLKTKRSVTTFTDIRKYDDVTPSGVTDYQIFTPKSDATFTDENRFAQVIYTTEKENKVTTDASGNKVTTKVDVEYTYYFMAPGSDLTADIINDYLKKTGDYEWDTDGSNFLRPVTTRGFDASKDEFHLYQAPMAGQDRKVDVSTLHDPKPYTDISFAFRVINANDNSYMKNQDIYLSDCSLHLNDQSTVRNSEAVESARIYFDGGTDAVGHTKFLLKPASTTSGETITAGVLDLNRDGYYDYTYDSGSGLPYYANGDEIIYGLEDKQKEEVKNSSSYHTFTSEDQTPTNNNINSYYDNPTEDSPYNTFYATHKVGNKGVLDYSSIDMPKSKYLGTDDIYPIDEGGLLSGGKILASTSDDDLSLANLNIKLYLEGWDHQVVDSNLNFMFDLGLTFQINRVN